jgi:DNA repair exonuclease SbcCD ATPase subunit
MDFVTAGITLGISLLAIGLIRYLDRNNHSINMVRNYGKKLMGDIASFADEKAASVRDYGVELEVKRDAAKELLSRLSLTEEELAVKADAVGRIGAQIAACDTALANLVREMTQINENFLRLRNEHVFVEQIDKKLGEVKARFNSVGGEMTALEQRFERANAAALEQAGKKLDGVQARYDTIEKGLGALELRFEHDNAESLEKTAESVVASVRSAVLDLQAAAETVERQVEEHREEVNRVERERRENLEKDIAALDTALEGALERAGIRSDRLEETTLARLQEDALKRAKLLRETVEEKIKEFGEQAETQAAEIHNVITSCKEEQKNFQAEWKRDIDALDALVLSQRAWWNTQAEETEARVVRQWKSWSDQADETETRFAELGKKIGESALEAERRVLDETERRFAEYRETQERQWNEWNAKAVVAENRLDTLDREFAGNAAELERRVLDETEHKFAGYREIQERYWNEWNAKAVEAENRLATLDKEFAGNAAALERRVLDETERKFAEYREIQERQWERLESMTDETGRLEGQLKHIIEEAQAHVRGDFAAFAEEQNKAREQEAQSFAETFDALRGEMAGLEQELAALKENASENVSEKYRLFEDEFVSDLARRGREIDARLAEWQKTFNARLGTIAEEAGADRERLELDFAEEFKRGLERLREEAGAFEAGIRAGMAETDRSLAGLQDQLKADLEDTRHQADKTLNAEIGRYALEMSDKIRQSQREMEDWQNKFSLRLRAAEDAIEDARRHSHDLFADTGDRISRVQDEIEEVKGRAVAGISQVKNEFDLSRQEALSGVAQLKTEINTARKDALADITQIRDEAKFIRDEAEAGKAELFARAEVQLKSFEEALKNARNEAEAGRADIAARAGAQFKSFEEALKNAQSEAEAGKLELFARAETQIRTLEDAVKETDRRVRDFSKQTKLFERADELKLDLERRIEDLKGDLKGLDQRRTEAAQIEAQCVTVRRIGDEVNTKMTRFLSEKHHLDVLENDFNRLIATSQAVEEKLRAVTSNDDILSGMQLQLRKIADAMKESEERYQRLERRNEVLDEANAGIDRSFKRLEETEAALRQLDEAIGKSRDELDGFRVDIAALAAAGEKVNDAAGKLELLDKNLAAVETRIEKMQAAREWIAGAETRLEELNREIQSSARLASGLLNSGGRAPPDDRGGKGGGAPSIAARENVIKLARQGWKDDEIATALKISKGEVELIREMGLKD